MSDNSFGRLFRVTTFGESHGPAIGCVIDGCPPSIELDYKHIQDLLDKRKPGQTAISTERKEEDAFEIISGVFECFFNVLIKLKQNLMTFFPIFTKKAWIF